MPNRPNIQRLSARIILPALLGVLLSGAVSAANYTVKIKAVRVESISGDVIIQVKPGNKENGFSGKARVMLANADNGTNRALALLLTAVTLNTEVSINVTNPPSYDDIQNIDSISLSPP